MSQEQQELHALLASLMQELRRHSGATIRGIRRAHLSQASVYACLFGETNEYPSI